MQNIKLIANKIKEAGGNLYLVGGAVRDELLGKATHDEDYCVTGIAAEKFQEIFPEAYIRGKAFAVFDIEGNEFALARTEEKQGIGHKEFEITTDPKITIKQDLARRDITINAIAKDVLTEEIIDPFNGKADLENKIIRATTKHFKEDPLRVYRVARFASQLEFEVEKETIKQMYELKSELDSLSSERVFTELSKALNMQKPSIFFEVLKKADVLDIHFKEIKDLIGAEQPPKYYPEGDAYNHTMLVLDMAAELTEHYYGHENSGAELVGKFGNKIKAPNNWLKCGKTACREHMRGGIFYKMKPSKKVEFIERVDKSLLGLDGLQIVVICDKTSGGRHCCKDDISFQYIGKKCLNEIDGEYIKNKYDLNPGIEFGNKLHEERIKWMKNYFNI